LRFFTEELGFESDKQAIEFFQEHNAMSSLEQADDDNILVHCSKAAPIFDQLSKDASKRIDIKGQI
jgi:hypothetical protein